MKKIIIAFLIIITLFLAYFIGSGFGKISSANIYEYSISEDGKEITLNMGVASSAGYIRKVAINQQHGGKMYLDCYAAFGGFNGNIGAKSTYTLPLNEETTVIAIYRNTNAYEEVLVKDSDGVWQRTQ